MAECKACILGVYKNGLCYYHAGQVRDFSGLYKVSESMWRTPKDAKEHKACTICNHGLLTSVEQATGLCYYCLRK